MKVFVKCSDFFRFEFDEGREKLNTVDVG